MKKQGYDDTAVIRKPRAPGLRPQPREGILRNGLLITFKEKDFVELYFFITY